MKFTPASFLLSLYDANGLPLGNVSEITAEIRRSGERQLEITFRLSDATPGLTDQELLAVHTWKLHDAASMAVIAIGTLTPGN